jgi:CheY-like chemotaxis protein
VTSTYEQSGTAPSWPGVAPPVEAVEAFTRWCHTAVAQGAAAGASREDRLSAARQRQVVERAQQAMKAHLDTADARGARRDGSTRATLVLGQRNGWFAERIRDLLTPAGVRVVATLDNGADIIGVCLAEQPDLILLEEQLPMLPGDQTVAALRAFSPASLVLVQTQYSERTGDLLDSGAAAVFARQVPPADVAAEVRRLLEGPSQR